MKEEERESLADDIAARVNKKIDTQSRQFYMAAQEHYDDHKDMKNVIKVYNAFKTMIWYVFAGLVIVGLVTLVVIGFANSDEVKSVKENLEILRPHG